MTGKLWELKVWGQTQGRLSDTYGAKKEPSHNMFSALKFVVFEEEHRSLQKKKQRIALFSERLKVVHHHFPIDLGNAHKGDKVVTHSHTHGDQHDMLGNVSNPSHSISPIKLQHH